MNRMQKMAWFLLVTASASLFSSLLAFAVLYFKYGLPKAYAGFALMSLMGVIGFSPLFFRKDKTKVVFDERDQLIQRNAAMLGFTAAFLTCGVSCMFPFFVLGSNASISVKWLPNIWLATFMAQFIAYSVAILVQYGREGKHER